MSWTCTLNGFSDHVCCIKVGFARAAKPPMLGAINTAIRRGPDTLERISVLRVARQASVHAVFILHTSSTTVYFEENSRVSVMKCTYLIHVNMHAHYTTDTVSI
jgi:hypothetical protein